MGYLTGVIILLLCATTTSFSQCPSITVLGPAGVTNPGDTMTFQVKVGTIGPKLSFNWSVDIGTIEDGQGTSKISVRTTRELAGQTITATVKIEGLLSSCPNTASESAPIYEPPRCGLPMDSWGRLNPNDERGRLDMLFVHLINNPGQIGMIVLRATDEDKMDSRNTRIQFILRHAKFRKFDKGRIWFALERAEERQTILHSMPRNAEPPCDDCLIIKGEHLEKTGVRRTDGG